METKISTEEAIKWYSKEAVKKSIVENAKGREVAVKFGEGGFGKRPDTLTYPDDVVELAKQGATSFHISEEHWQNVLQVNPELKRAELDKLRTGWDLIIDVDCQELDYSKITAHLLVQALKYH